MTTRRPATPVNILDELFGAAAPVLPSPAPARELLRAWQEGDAAEQTATLAAIQPPAPAGLATIDAARLTPAVYRTAVRLLARAEPSGVLWVAPEEGLDVFGNEDYGAQRAHLYHLKRAGLIDYSHRAGWFVRFLAPLQNRALALQNGALALQNRAESEIGALQNRALALQDCNGAETVAELQLQNGALALQNGALALQDCNGSAITNKAVCLFVDSDTTNKQLDAPEPEPPFVPDPFEANTARRLLTDIGVAPKTADLIVARRSLFDVRRVVGYAWINRREVGGNLQKWVSFAVTALNEPQRHGIPATISQNFLHSELHRQHLTPAELAEYTAVEEEPEPAPLVRVHDDDAQMEPDDATPTGFDPVRTWAEFAATRESNFGGTKLLAYDPETGEATISAPANLLERLMHRGAIVVRRDSPVYFGRPVFARFEETQP